MPEEPNATGMASPRQFGAPLFETEGPSKFRKEISELAKQVERVAAGFERLDRLDLARLRQAVSSVSGMTQTLVSRLPSAGGTGAAGSSAGWSGGQVPMTTAPNGGVQHGGGPGVGGVITSATQPMSPPAQPSQPSMGRALGGVALAGSAAAARFMEGRQADMFNYNFYQSRTGLYSGASTGAITAGLFGGSTGLLGRSPTDVAQAATALQGVAGGAFLGGGMAGANATQINAAQRLALATNPAMSGAQAAGIIQSWDSPRMQRQLLSYGFRTQLRQIGGAVTPNSMLGFAQEYEKRIFPHATAPLTAQQITAHGDEIQANLTRVTGNADIAAQVYQQMIGNAAYRTKTGQNVNASQSEQDVAKQLGLTNNAEYKRLQRQTTAAKREAGLIPGEAAATQTFDRAVADFSSAVSRFEGLFGGKVGGLGGLGAAGLGGLSPLLGGAGSIINTIGMVKILRALGGKGLGQTAAKVGGDTAGSTVEATALEAAGGAGVPAVAGAAGIGTAGTVGLAGAAIAGTLGLGYLDQRLGKDKNKTRRTINKLGLAVTSMGASVSGHGLLNLISGKAPWSGQNPFGDGPGSSGGGSNTVSQLEGMVSGLGVPFVVTSSMRSNDSSMSYHSKGEAIDIAPPSGGQDNDGLRELNNMLAAKYGSGLSELIYSGPGGVFIKDGKVVSASFYSDALAEHHNHVHVAASPEQLAKIGNDIGLTGGSATSSGASSATAPSPSVSSALGEGNNYSEASTLSRLTSTHMKSPKLGGKQGNATANGGAAGAFGAYPQVPSSKGGGIALSGSQLDAAVTTALGLLNLSDQSFHAGVLHMIQSESGGKPGVVNDWDSNAQAGHPSIGLMQTIKSTFDAYALPGHGDITNPIDNILAGVGYAMKNYGPKMLQAGGRQDSNGNYVGYERGTLNVDRDQLALLHKGEQVVRSADASMNRARDAQGRNGVIITFEKGSIVVSLPSADSQEAEAFAEVLIAKIEKKAGLIALGRN